MTDASLTAPSAAQSPARQTWGRILSNTSVRIGGTIALIITLMGIFAPVLDTRDPAGISPANRNKSPGYEASVRDRETGQKMQLVYRFGSDTLGRDVYSRVIYGARTSLIVGVSVAAIAIAVGLTLGLVAGYFRLADSIIMRVMDGICLLYTSPSPRDRQKSRMPSSA